MFGQSPREIAGVKFGEIEFVGASRLPKPEVVCSVSVKTRDWGIVSLGYYLLCVEPFGSDVAFVIVFFNSPVEFDNMLNVLSFNFPWTLTSFEPIVWNLYLISLDDSLLKHSIIVSDSVTPSRDIKCSE